MEKLEQFKDLLEYKEENSKTTVAVGMSGGVDSSAVAYLLKRQGYNVIGITMKHWSAMDDYAESDSKTCCSLDDIYDAKRVCDDLGIPHYVVNLEEQFKEVVVGYFVDEYSKGRTPNPCMVCNRYIKLGKLIDFAKNMGADYLATGHYAQIKNGQLYIGDDPKKDQVYFLSQVKREYIKHLMFPLGKLEKTQVRELAKELGVRVYAKKDSQEICFVEDGKTKEFLVDMTKGKILNPGNIVNENGIIVGKHEGLAFYTIGQRKGLGIAHPTPLYVLGIDTEKNHLIVGDNESLFKDSLTADKLNVLAYDSVEELDGLSCMAKTRSRDLMHMCRVELIGDNEIKVVFTEDKVRAVTPGQGVVLYGFDGKVLASAFIKS